MPDDKTDEGPGALFRAGQLAAAVAAANVAVRKTPGDIAARVLLAELLLFSGNHERADVILDAATEIEPEAALVVAEFRQLLRAEMARRQSQRDGRVPEFLGEPTESQRLLLAAAVALRAGDAAEASAQAAAAEAARPPCPGRSASKASGAIAFEDFRDADDLCAGSLEVLTTTGKYFWIPMERITSIDFHPPKRARDLYWRRATMSVRDGPDGDVYVPALYGNGGADLSDALRLGRATDWVEESEAPVRGVGQRVFLMGEEALDVMSLETLEFGTADT